MRILTRICGLFLGFSKINWYWDIDEKAQFDIDRYEYKL